MLRRLFKHVYFQVFVAIFIGVAIGHFFPTIGQSLKPLSDGFIRLVKMITPPLIFVTIVSGASQIGDLKALGKIGGKTLIYFEIVTTLALLIGLALVNMIEPGAMMNLHVGMVDAHALQQYQGQLQKESGLVGFLLNIIPNSAIGAFATGDMLQILLFSCLFAVGVSHLGEKGKMLLGFFEGLSDVFFKIVGIVMRLAPIGAFGAMGYSVGKYGLSTLHSLGMLLITVYAATILFMVFVLGTICRASGFSLWRLLGHIKGEILLVLATTSSESVFPQLIRKLEGLGCPKQVVGIVMPMGYSFNLDGTCVAQVICAMFIAQAFGVHMSLVDQLTLLGVSMLTSKGSAGVAGASFVALLATLTTFKHIPIEGAALILGVDRFISEIRAVTNMIGNAVATLVISGLEKKRDNVQLNLVLNGRGAPFQSQATSPSESCAVPQDSPSA
ncbi:C4-dicarboxylate transporter DctA [Cupriavidus consociatus]|uniref:C4-dicarboxylate transporter DctA n=1 Tax=Cupriavidus consociatus TaxID=2821357 RepID=UPI001AEB4954|nr:MULTISPECIES: C4-dicarboxylate transporter DctA [unclassified Cupriavidus]MBP0625077.1 C4-dicarboxylate transporter DctA [Cupriavidus sp. LEh25]MDK2661813.1 C4-dicarboxylate transporter DctA [Cupriavidus sp. LEh21]